MVDDYIGDDIASLSEDILVKLILLVNLIVDVEKNLLKLCVLDPLAQNRVDLKFSLLAPTGALYMMIM